MRLSFVLLFLQLWGAVSSVNECPVLPHVPHAYVSEESKQTEYQEGDVIYFTCETGYMSGLAIKYICSDKSWLKVHQRECYLRPCELPEDTPNGFYEIVHGQDFVYGTIIKYFCNEGYQMMSRNDTRICMLNKWTNQVPICDPLRCDPPPADEQVIVKGLPENGDSILPDRFITFSCDGPGKYLNGSSMLICGRDGKWDHPFPTCQEKCKVTGVPNNVMLSIHLRNSHLETGEKLRFACRQHGELLQGKAEVECLANGQWSDHFPTCAPPLTCERPPPLADGDTKETLRYRYNHNDRVEFRCQRYYILEGGPYKTCINGEWIGEMRCIEPCTVNEEAMRRNNIRLKYRYDSKLYSRHDDEIHFACTVGRPDGILNMRQRCVEGVILLPTCH